jgi:hypothetical protein
MLYINKLGDQLWLPLPEGHSASGSTGQNLPGGNGWFGFWARLVNHSAQIQLSGRMRMIVS